ncbi:MAG TPA: hypothetical protein VI979_04785 [archaeon]|nr:hypothetical protein [archaeon]
MNYITNFQNRVLSSISDHFDKNLLIFLEKRERLQNIEETFGNQTAARLEKLAKAGLIVERLRNNPSDIQRYFETTSLGKNALKYLISKEKDAKKEE